MPGSPFCALPSYLYLKPNGTKTLGRVLQTLTPGLIYLAKEAAETSLERIELYSDAPVITSVTAHFPASSYSREAALEAHNARTGPSSIAKFLLTSGTTGEPKLVIQTHGMMLANQAMLAYAFPFLEEQPPVLVDCLPWSHAFGSNHNFGLALYHGGSFHVDGGSPTPEGLSRRCRTCGMFHLRSISTCRPDSSSCFLVFKKIKLRRNAFLVAFKCFFTRRQALQTRQGRVSTMWR